MRQRSGRRSHPDEHLVPVSAFQRVFDALPLRFRVEGRQTRSSSQALRSAGVPRHGDAGRQEEEVTSVPSRDEAQAALLCSVRAVRFVLCQRAVRVGVAREVLPEVRPVRHGAVPLAGCKLFWQRRVVVEGEQ